ncbi:fumarylacetoacetate hydrolase family protein [Dendrosporobacter sp. 1207_IL3150]|uniref:fumarylacetoacetate hydrolase family protein n=1 Tax=Dendrosporobacter sp. 1207_IL3150 TaxID=3084054 RepID=UPI002FDB1D81
MKLVTYEEQGAIHVGLLTESETEIVPIAEAERKLFGSTIIPDSMIGIINTEAETVPLITAIREKHADIALRTLALNSVQLLAPIPRPVKNIFCIGKNYREHVKETQAFLSNADIPQFPIVFSKAPTAVTGPEGIIKNHTAVKRLDYEAELAVIIGKKGKEIKKEEAYDYIFGYTILNDVSARDLQIRHGQWLLGKSCDTYAPMGPCIVHKSALLKAQELDIECKVNDEIRQSANTSDMIFDIPTLIETISSVITLEPGDIIATGTPSGVGIGFNPPKYLSSGDVIEIYIEGIGILRNKVE